MGSPLCDRSILDALKAGKALLRYISANDTERTRSHQAGFYLPKAAWRIYTPHQPEKGQNRDHFVDVTWQDGRVTNSCVKWYGKKKSEYRLTGRGKDFPYKTDDCIGDLLVLVPMTSTTFHAYLLHDEDDITEIQAALGTEIIGTWGVYDPSAVSEPETTDQCLDRQFREYTEMVSDFPTGEILSKKALLAATTCIEGFGGSTLDDQLLHLVDIEYSLFRMVERKICQPEITRLFKSIDDFISTASSLMNRRKSRAGRALENHVEYILTCAKVPFSIRPNVDGKPDVIFPNKTAYDDPHFPDNNLNMLGIKTTCKDRWRQVLNEAKRIEVKHLLTLQQGISRNQLAEMQDANVVLVVPAPLHDKYPKEFRGDLLTVDGFVRQLRSTYN